MEVVEFGRLTNEYRSELEGDEKDPFDAAGSALQFRAKEKHVGLRDDQGRLLASTGLLVVDVEVVSERFAVVGFGGVIVNEHRRGRGLGREVVGAALAKAATLGPQFVILFCHQDRAGLYTKLGFAEVRSPVQVMQPTGYALMLQQTMWRALRPDAEWPAGAVAVQSLPF
jgi:predicted N-acetyltransferase YhbS